MLGRDACHASLGRYVTRLDLVATAPGARTRFAQTMLRDAARAGSHRHVARRDEGTDCSVPSVNSRCALGLGDGRVGELLALAGHVLSPGRTIPVAHLEAA